VLTHYDEFSGLGGTSKGWSYVPWVQMTDAANHDQHAIDSHELNFPNARHYREDVTKLDMTKMPRADIFTASPVCPPWTDANGVKRDFDKVNAQQSLFDDPDEDDPKLAARKEKYRRARLLMNEVPKYLRAIAERGGRPVLVGMVENVIQCRLWAEWDRWIAEIRALGYRTRLIAFNSMHAVSPKAPRAPQSRDRLYLAFWHKSLGRDPDWDKWLRPKAWCPDCARVVDAIQVFKKSGADMGRYRSQYVYRCPQVGCRHREVFPEVVPALAAIDPSIPGIRIGDREARGLKPLEPATMERISAGVRKYWLPLLTPAGGTWRDVATPLTVPMPTRTTRENDGIAVPPLLVPVEGRPGKVAASVAAPIRTQTTRNETGYATLPFITPLRGGGDKGRARAVTEPLTTVTAAGNHHGLALPPLVMRNFTARSDQGQMSTPADEPMRTVTANGKQSLLTWASQLLVPYYGAAETAQPATGPVGTLTTRDRYGLAQLDAADFGDFDLDDVLFRMLEPHEIARAMAFEDDYKIAAKSKRIKVRLYGNAVTPPIAELIGCALVEAITGEAIEPAGAA
jgi:DNA (cytosine-5)-methyltransferase 1